MKHFILLLIFGLVFSFMLSFNLNSSDAPQQDYKDGDKVYVQFSATWCGPCRAMKGLVNNDKKFLDFIKEKTKGYYFIDVESTDVNDKQWVKAGNPSALPTVVVYVREGNTWKEHKRQVGMVNTDFLRTMVK